MELTIEGLETRTSTVKLDGKQKQIRTTFLKKLYVGDLIQYMKE